MKTGVITTIALSAFVADVSAVESVGVLLECNTLVEGKLLEFERGAMHSSALLLRAPRVPLCAFRVFSVRAATADVMGIKKAKMPTTLELTSKRF